ncbi:metallophosphoesterase [Pseudomonas mandelii]|uniref:metallophosphoesterase n=1 Tax=Pseudomonas mandelii TaxID=75612 RepID=UPI001C84009D|nr:metallophosphoesterase [Pseudomonas mandelii]QZA99252.1 metallophosphoesterase [Pseudomonas mandelii]
MPAKPKVQRFKKNTAGTDWVVGDIHGHFSKLQVALGGINFNPATDRLFSVGDLVDRGPESVESLIWLNKSWFHPVQGNHEDMAISHARNARGDGDMYLQNGGAWFLALNWDEQQNYAAMFADLPVAIEVETASGIVGIVHADCPYQSWTEFTWALENGGPAESEHLQTMAQWSRKRITDGDQSQVSGVRAVVVGHTPLRQSATLGNVTYIDTAAWMGGHFTLLKLSTLECFPPANPELSHDWD